MLFQEPDLPLRFAHFLRALAARQQVYVVGGFLRDALLGLPPSDADFATDAPPDMVTELAATHDLKIFADRVAAVHGTWRMTTGRPHEVLDLARLRKDVARTGVRHATVAFTDNVEEDLARRDLTINGLALAYPFAGPATSLDTPLRSASSSRLIDCFGGQHDLRQRTLRLIGDAGRRLAEDPLRALRVLRFACRGHAWRVDAPTWRAIQAAAPRVGEVSFERMRAEWQKSLPLPVPSRFVSLALAGNLMPVLWPGPVETFSFAAAAATLAAAESRYTDPTLRWHAWLLGGVRPSKQRRLADRRQAWQTSKAARVAERLARLRFAQADALRAVLLCRLFPFRPQDLTGTALAAWLIELGAQGYGDVVAVGRAACTASIVPRPAFAALLRRSQRLIGDDARAALSRASLAIDGRLLQREQLVAPGPAMGRLLQALHVYAVEHRCQADRERLLAVARDWLAPA